MNIRRLLLLPVVAVVPALCAVQPATTLAASTQGPGCIAPHPNYIENPPEFDYAPRCPGDDDTALDPVHAAPGSAAGRPRTAGPGRPSHPTRLLARRPGLFDEAQPRLVGEHARRFEAECRDLLRQLEMALRETYFHPSKVPSTVFGEEGRAMPQQQQQSTSPSFTRLARIER